MLTPRNEAPCVFFMGRIAGLSRLGYHRPWVEGWNLVSTSLIFPCLRPDEFVVPARDSFIHARLFSLHLPARTMM